MSPGVTGPYVSAYAYAADQPTVYGDPSGLILDGLRDSVTSTAGSGLGALYHGGEGVVHGGERVISGGADLATRGVHAATSGASLAWRHRDEIAAVATLGAGPAAAKVQGVVAGLIKETAAVYRESGGGWRGALDAFNRVWNPGFQILAASDSCLTGYGTSNGWGRGTSCASAAVQIGLFVAAPVAGKALTAAIGGRGAELPAFDSVARQKSAASSALRQNSSKL